MTVPQEGANLRRASREATYVALAAGGALGALLPLIASKLEAEPACHILVFFGNYDDRSDVHVEALLALKDLHVARLAIHFIMEREAEESELLSGRLDAAKLRKLAAQLFEARAVKQYLLTGRADFVSDLRAELQHLGVAPGQVLVSGAASLPSVTGGGETAAAPLAGVTQVDVIMDGRRKSFSMQTGTESILDAAARAGIDLPFSCRAGVCSTCRTKLVRGEVELAQNYALEDWELAQGFILACQAHAKTDALEITYDET
ncbi:MAG TPA: 2Fe-2S iron-sulfur cluster-binding protein [Steroidobacteraceae bacterium]